MDKFKKFKTIVEKKEDTEINKNTQEHHEKLSPKRLGRFTGSMYDKIKFTEEKKLKGKTPTKKDDLIAWILSRREGKSLLDTLILQESKESAEKLNNEQLKQLIDSMTGDFIINDGTLSYMYTLIAELITEEKAPQIKSAALAYGIEHEAEALNTYKEIALKKNPFLVFKENEFLINPFLKLTGSTPDLNVFDSRISLDNPIGVVENKCPFNAQNHARNYDRAYSKDFKHLTALQKVDERYQKQVLGHIYNSNSLWCDFTSFNPSKKAKEKGFHFSCVRVLATEVQEELSALERDLFNFAGAYKEKIKNIGLSLESIL